MDEKIKEYSLELNYAGYMFTDYFCGTSGCLLVVFCHNEMTVKEVIDYLEQEANTLYDHLVWLVENKGFQINKLEHKLELLFKDLREKNKENMDSIFRSDIITKEEYEYTDNEIPAAIFVIEIKGEDYD